MLHSPSRTCRRLGAVALLATILAAPAVAPRTLHAAPSPSTMVIVTGGGLEPDTLDPDKAGTAIAALILRYVGDPLIRLDPKGNYVPGLATKWAISDGGLRYAFTLRQDVSFQDGTPLTAADVVKSFERAVDPAIKSPGAGALLAPVSSFKLTGKYTFELRLKQPYAFLMHNLADAGYLPIISRTALRKEGSSFGRHPVSTGPWMVSNWTSGVSITLVKNPNYHWGPSFTQSGPPRIDQLVFRFIQDEATQTAAFQSGEVDELTVPSSAVQRLEAMHKYSFVKFPDLGVQLMEFNVLKPPFNDIRVRQAMNYAIDKNSVLQIAISGQGEPAYGVLPPSILGYWPGIVHYRYSYNPQKALALLAQAGWVMKNGVLRKNGQPFTFTLFNNTTDEKKRAALVVQAQLKQIGVQMKIQQMDDGTLISRAEKGEQQADFLGYRFPTADIFYLWFDSSNIGSGLAMSHDADPKTDALIAKMRAATDPAALNVAIADLQRYIADQALWVPLYTPYLITAFQPRVHGVILDTIGNFILNNATLSS